MLLTGLIGASVDYSISPGIFDQFFKDFSIAAEYRIFNLRNDEIKDFMDLHLHDSNALGFNVTIPYKSAIIPHIDFLDQSAKEIGAVNCIYKNAGSWVGTNTDYHAFAATLKPIKKGINSVLILGAGGAAKAILYAIQNTFKFNSFIWTRDSRQLDKFTDDSGGVPWDNNKVDLIINCTPVGTIGNNDIFPDMILEKIKSAEVYYDLVYNPSETKLIKMAKENGVKTMNGLPMLLEQASLSANKWFGKKFNHILFGKFREKYSQL